MTILQYGHTKKVGFICSPFAYREVKPSDVVRYEIYAYPTQFNIDFGF